MSSINELKDKRIIILGFGREGKDNFRFLRKLFPKKFLAIADENKNIGCRLTNIKCHFGKNYLKSLKNYDIIVKSPGIPWKTIVPFTTKKQKITSQTEIFFDNCPGRIVGITGTKGKSTTASIIYEILKKGGLKAHLAGNIGKPVLNLLWTAGPTDVYVYELSSHQLHNLKKSPDIAVFLNLFPEHLDYYRSFKEYARAKANITLYQKKDDYLIYNSQDKIVRKITAKSKARKIPVRGEYYELNKAAARAVGKIFEIPSKTVEKAIKRFKPLPHRLESVGTFKGIAFYNDALATVPEATVAALKTLGGKVATVILGGFDRKIDFKKLAEEILRSQVKTVILFPTTGKKIWQALSAASSAKNKKPPQALFIEQAGSGARYMEKAVRSAYQHTKPGKICLLSTASASFNLFKDYQEKGNLFKKYVKKYGRSKTL
jgi:UDP-N-acetylmuramoyl-L-alanine---L-glutamate ligase